MRRRGCAILAVGVLALLAAGCSSGKGTVEQRPEGQGAGQNSGHNAGHNSDDQGSQTAMHESHYQKFLGARKSKGGQVAEDQNLRVGDWRFFYEFSDRTPKAHPAAVDSSGRVVAPAESKDNLHAFLATEGMSAGAALERLAWLLSAIPLTAEATDMPEDVQAVLTDPTLERQAGGAMRFVGWMAMPPNVDTPVRFELDAPASGAVQARFVGWEEVAQDGK